MIGIFNDSLVWILKRRMARIRAFIDEPMETQARVFRQLIDLAKNTEWGEKYEYSTIKSIREFQKRVPVSGYEEIFPYIERMMQGEQNILWGSHITWFSKSSGTTNARSKFIPVSDEAMDGCHFMGGKDLMTLYIEHHCDTKIFQGKGLSVGGSLSVNPLNPDSFAGDVSAVLMKNLPIWAQIIRTPPLEVALMDGWEHKIAEMASITAQENVTSMLGVPTWCLVLIDHILKETKQENILETWHNFELFVHGAVAFQPYRELFKTTIFPSSHVRYLETYNASEGFFALQDDLNRPDEMLLMLDYGIFYEFIPIDQAEIPYPDALTIEEVEIGKNYALVISTNAGLWRYRIGDTVRFTSIKPYRIKISGRTKHFINAFGEEVIVENADAAIAYACQVTHAEIAEYTAAPAFMDNKKAGYHQWIIEFKRYPNDISTFAECLDNHIRNNNSDYDAKRYQNMVLQMPQIQVVPAGIFYQWMRSRNKLGGQHKVPRLSNTREYIDDLLQMI